jgi:hypothetical protein
MTAVVCKRVLSQWVAGYNFTPHYGESVVASVWLMPDGTRQTLYDGHRTDNNSGMTMIHEYGETCPTLDRVQP